MWSKKSQIFQFWDKLRFLKLKCGPLHVLYNNSQNDTQSKNVYNFGISQQNLMIYG